MRKENITNKIIMRAVELWCRKLLNPKFDNGDDSDTGCMTHMLATINIQNDKNRIPDLSASIEKFRTVLTEKLIQLRDNPAEGEYFNTYLDVDYRPCLILAEAADIAGIPHSMFSCKSSVSMDRYFPEATGRVSTSFGYGAPHIYHYPLPDGRWLMTSLNGEDINLVINDVMVNNNLGLPIDPA
jgi:hypothetical protein